MLTKARDDVLQSLKSSKQQQQRAASDALVKQSETEELQSKVKLQVCEELGGYFD